MAGNGRCETGEGRVAIEPDPVGWPRGTQIPGGCRWVYGEPMLDLESWRYCGRPRSRRTSSWCAGHRAVALERAQ